MIVRSRVALASVGLLASAGMSRGALISESASAPTTAVISQPDFSAAAFNGGQDFSDNAGPPGQTFTPATPIVLNAVTVKGFANTSGSFGGLSGTTTATITISSVAGTTLTNVDQESATFNPANGANYFTFTFDTPVALLPGTQYAYSIFSSAGYFGFAKSSTDVYAPGAAIQQGSVARTAATGATILNQQTVDRTFFINPAPVPEPASAAVFGVVGAGLLLRRRRRSC